MYKPSALNLSEDSAEVIIPDDKPYVYTGKAIAPTVQVKYEEELLNRVQTIRSPIKTILMQEHKQRLW